MYRNLLFLIFFLSISAFGYAQDSLPIVEIKADRTIIYPQRMELSGEETLMDVLQMMPDLMIAGYVDVISDYNLRIDNVPVNGDNRLILSQMKARDIEKIQVCDNTGVAKGTIGTGNVLDINMKMPEKWSGFVEARGDIGKEKEGNGTVNVLYGSKSTDLYANATYRYEEGNMDYVTLHMTNRFDSRNRLLTYFTQQYIELPDDEMRKVLGRARYFHAFNDKGTELLLVGSYQYSNDHEVTNRLPMGIIELNTPLFSKRMSMTLGVEGDYLMSSQESRDWNWHVFNNDVYLQLTYTLPRWRFTAGNRIMLYGYKLMDEIAGRSFNDTRDNTNACVIFVPDSRNQVQLGYYRKFYSPAYETLFLNTVSLSYETWLLLENSLNEWDINQVKLAYTYSKPKFTLQAESSFYVVEGERNFAEVNASAYWKSGWLTLTGGTHLSFTSDQISACLRLAPTACLPHRWRIGMQMVYYTNNTPQRALYGTPVYGCLSISKQFGRHWTMGVDWHDMFDACSTEAVLNRHAANIHLRYGF